MNVHFKSGLYKFIEILITINNIIFIYIFIIFFCWKAYFYWKVLLFVREKVNKLIKYILIIFIKFIYLLFFIIFNNLFIYLKLNKCIFTIFSI
jgi:hypothetical protein